jgi:hypothetical protein
MAQSGFQGLARQQVQSTIQQGFTSLPGMVDKLAENAIDRQLLLRDTTMGSESYWGYRPLATFVKRIATKHQDENFTQR